MNGFGNVGELFVSMCLQKSLGSPCMDTGCCAPELFYVADVMKCVVCGGGFIFVATTIGGMCS